MRTTGDRTFECQHLENIFVDIAAERLQFRQIQFGEILVARNAMRNRLADNFMCITKSQSLSDQVIRQISRC